MFGGVGSQKPLEKTSDNDTGILPGWEGVFQILG
jgi:hypothetical protein